MVGGLIGGAVGGLVADQLKKIMTAPMIVLNRGYCK